MKGEYAFFYVMGALTGFLVGLFVSLPPARAWEIAPAQYIDVGTTIEMTWPQWRLQQECAPQSREAVNGDNILACTWQAYGLCFTAYWTGLPAEERAALKYYHEDPHCAGWAWDHPQ